MKHLKRLLCAVGLVTSLMVHAQDGEKGIKWATGLSWEQIKQKAKAENKYIFIDAYATWCGPCKMMDRDVYPNGAVGDLFNQRFISVKAQMDLTDKDDQNIMNWYADAKKLKGMYDISAFPSLIFLSPQANILYKIEGYRDVQKFVDTAKLVLTNGTIYNDPYKEYKALISDYKQGVKHYDRMPYMISTAFKLDNPELAREMFRDHLNYAATISENERYTKENIMLWNSFVFKLDSKALQFFLKDSVMIDQVMGQRGYSNSAVDRTIQGRIVDSFFRMQKGMTTTITGVKVPNSEITFMSLPERRDGKIQPDYVEADWKKLAAMIREHFNEDFTTRNVYWAKMKWYGKHQNKEAVSKIYFKKLEEYSPEALAKEADLINQICWETFLYSTDKKLLKKALAWMEKIMEQVLTAAGKIDTYANLLYKLGRTKEAIQWEEKAVNVLAPTLKEGIPNEFKPVLEKIKRGEPTYQEQGAVWETNTRKSFGSTISTNKRG